MADERFGSFAEFWPFYVREHSVPACRAVHFIGSSLAIAVVVAAVSRNNYWLLLAAPLVGYGFAWFGHFVIEKNKPASFKYPLWSFVADWKMWALILTGRMGVEVQKASATSK